MFWPQENSIRSVLSLLRVCVWCVPPLSIADADADVRLMLLCVWSSVISASRALRFGWCVVFDRSCFLPHLALRRWWKRGAEHDETLAPPDAAHHQKIPTYRTKSPTYCCIIGIRWSGGSCTNRPPERTPTGLFFDKILYGLVSLPPLNQVLQLRRR